ncbi:Uncharacterized protein FWK35_00027559 [Aphis craccivora]|uniref:Uncharacterized protein n=1 Tax=Aphis craccivora TaxID=307492 RepID=A0A6G0ZJJ3_APHCR|nr:Uncharacterized protein FWK35_00027559 [Aphis craccivora]
MNTPGSYFDDDIKSNINDNTQCSKNEGKHNDTSIKLIPTNIYNHIYSLEIKLESRTLNSSFVVIINKDMISYTSTLTLVKT